MAIVYANIGSNLGNRYELIQKALDEIAGAFGICCISAYIESEPWGFKSDNRFLNLGVSFKSDLAPEEILYKLQRIEKSVSQVSHRDEKGGYKDREIDIDIMAIDDMIIDSPSLTIPHRHLMDRDFFRVPLLELNPDWESPI